MPVVIDASSPAAVKSDTAVSSLTTAAFTPPAGAVLLMMALFDTATSSRTGTPSTVTGSTSAWTTVGNFNNGNGSTGGLVHVSWARVTTSQSTTARVTWPASNDCALKVWVLTGAPSSGSPIGKSGSATLTTNPQTVSYTATDAGSQGFIGLEDFSQAGVKTISNTTTEITLSANSNGVIARDSSTAGSAGQTRSFSISGTPGNASVGWVEVIPDGSTPPPGGGGGTGSFSGGSGGPLTDRTNVSYNNGTKTSVGHIYAAGLDWTKTVGLLVYTDGSGEFGLANTGNTYLLAGTNGLINVAKNHNMVLVTPRAPGDGCNDGDGVCWYDASGDGTTISQKIKWADDFIRTQVLQQYNIALNRICIAGYSSGAQFTSEYYGPQYAAAMGMEDGLLLPISFGGSPKVTVNYPTAFKQAVAAVWDVGANDPAYNSYPSYDAQSGYNWYTSNGFTTTELNVVAGEDHSRSGQFGPVVDREITQHVPATTTITTASSAVRVGAAVASAVRVGSALASKLYVGTTLLWQASGGGGGTGGSPTGGSGGPLTDRTSVSYNNGTKTSTYHIYAAGLDWTKRVGLVVYGDGSGEYGLANPSDTYLLAGTNGLINVAKSHNMVLVTPRAPGNGCTDGDGVCWYLGSNDGTTRAQKTKWLDDLIKTQVLPLYNIDKTRVCIGGFSSGAENAAGIYGPAYAASWMEDGLLLAISYGSSPSQYGITSTYTTAFKANVAAVWDVYANDETTAVADSLDGYNWYNSNGFATTQRVVRPGGQHVRTGEYGGIVDEYVTAHVIPTTG